MMKQIMYILSGILILLSACRDLDDPYVGYIQVDRAVLGYQAGWATVTADTDISGEITAQVDGDAAEWCKASVSGKEITITATENSLDEQRFATISVKCGYRTTSFQVIQKKEGLNYLEYKPTGWEATASSSQSGDGAGVTNIFTENRETQFWHSQYSPMADLPHWLLVDMQEELEIGMVRVAWRLYNGGNYATVRVVEVLVSSDGENFTSVGEILKEAPGGVTRSPDYPAYNDWVFNATKARYIKVLIKETNTANGACQVGYIKAYEIV